MAAETISGHPEMETGANPVHTLDAGGGDLTLPEGLSFSTASFDHSGSDMVMEWPDGTQVVVQDFFSGEAPPDLQSADGGQLSGDLAAELSGFETSDQVAQAGPAADAQPIGSVETLDGLVSVIRADGTQVELKIGDPVYQGDQLATGDEASVGIVLADETTFSMGENGSMVLDEMVYDPGTQEGSVSMSVLEGVFTFVSGQVAKTDPDAMSVNTPVATIGIRGTQVGLDLREGEPMSVVLMEERDGLVGEVVVTNDGGVQILNTAYQGTSVSSFAAAPSAIFNIAKSSLFGQFGQSLKGLPIHANPTANDYREEISQSEAAVEEDFAEEALAEEMLVEADVLEEDFAEEDLAEEMVVEADSDEEGIEELTEFETAAGGEDEQPELFKDINVSTRTTYDPLVGGNIDTGGSNVLIGGGGDDVLINTEDDDGPFVVNEEEKSPFQTTQIGSDEDDVMTGSAGADFMDGGGGDDVLYAGAGDDEVYGGQGDDLVIAGTGAGNDKYTGGMQTGDTDAGTDTITFQSSTEGVNVDLAAGTATDRTPRGQGSPDGEYIDTDEIVGFENVVGSKTDDLIAGNEDANILIGSDGADVLTGGAGDDVLIGGQDESYTPDLVKNNAEAVNYDVGTKDDHIDTAVFFGNVEDYDIVKSASGVITVTALATDEGTDTLIGIDRLQFGNTVVDVDQLILGSDAADELPGTAGGDVMFGGGGDDLLLGGGGDDIMIGGAGDDRIEGGAGEGDMAVFSGSFADYTIEINEATGEITVTDNRPGPENQGTDTLVGVERAKFADGVVSLTIASDADDTIAGGEGTDVIDGGAGDDTIDGGAGDDTISGGAGSDEIFGGAGNDVIDGGTGADVIDGGEGADTILGSDEDDVLLGGAGDDTITGGGGADVLDGGDGADTLKGSDDSDILIGGDGDDLLEGGGGSDLLYAGDGNDVVDAGAGNDVIIGGTGGGDDTYIGGAGDDTVTYQSADQGVDVNLETGTATGPDIDTDTLISIENVLGSKGDDTITGDAQDNVLIGSGGEDTIKGGAGDDILYGGDHILPEFEGREDVIGIGGAVDAADVLEGGAGDDTLVGGAGDDILDGGEGQDTVVFTGNVTDYQIVADPASGTITVTDLREDPAVNEGSNTLTDIEAIQFKDKTLEVNMADAQVGGEGGDELTGGDTSDVIDGGAGDDVLDGGAGDDLLLGSDGDDQIMGGLGDDMIFGGGGADILDGGEGADYIDGGEGDDILRGGAGEDVLLGGTGSDVIEGGSGDDIMAGGEGNDTIDGGEGTGDKVNLSGNRDEYEVIFNEDGTITIVDTVEGRDGTDTITNVELLEFGDGEVISLVDEAPPAAVDDEATTGEDSSVTIDVLANDVHPGGDTLSLQSATVTGGSGSVSIVDGKLVYDPGDAYNSLAVGEEAPVTIEYTITDSDGDTDTATVTLTVEGANDAPTAGDDTATVGEDASIDIDVLANDTDPDASDQLSVINPTIASGEGTVSVNEDGTLKFDPGDAYNSLGIDETATVTIEYTVDDGNGGTATATATVTVTGSNDGPVAEADTATMGEDAAAIVIDVLSNDTDVDGDSLTVTGADVTNGQGNVSVNTDGTLTFDPGDAYNSLGVGETADVTIEYTVDDGNGGTATATATVTVTGSNDGPVAVADEAQMKVDAPSALIIPVLANDYDPDASDSISVTGADITDGQGTVSVNEDGTLSYDPGEAYDHLGEGETATVEIQYTIADESGATSTTTATVTVTGTNDAPVATCDKLSGLEDEPITFTAEQLLANDTDPNNDELSIVRFTQPVDENGNSLGTIVDNEDGTYTFTPNENWSGQTDFEYTIADPAGAESTATVKIDVSGVADKPKLDVSLGEGVHTGGTGDSVSITFHGGTAGYENSYGYYLMDDNGNPTEGVVVWADVKQHYDDTITIDGLDSDQVGFFLLPNGGTENSGLEDGTNVTFQQDANGDWQAVTADGTVLETAARDKAFFTDQTLNPRDFDYEVDNENEGNQNWEDLLGGGDRDFDDANFTVDWEDGGGDGATVYPLNIDAALTDTDGSETLSLTVTIAPPEATLNKGTSDGNGNWTLDPNDLAGLTVTVPDSANEDISIQVNATSAEDGTTATASETVTIGDLNDAPVAEDDAATIGEDDYGNCALKLDVLANDTDPDAGDVLSLTSVAITSGEGTATIVDGQLGYDPGRAYNHLAEGETATVTIDYVVTDSDGNTDTATATVTIEGSNDGPIARADFAETTDDRAVTIDVLRNDTDADASDSLTVTGAEITDGQGTVTVNEDGSLSYDPGDAYDDLGAGESASVEITYQVSDGHGGYDTAVATVTVNGTNEGPVATPDELSGKEDQSITFTAESLLANDSDPNADALSITDFTQPADGMVVANDDGTFTFTPNENWSGETTFEYTVSDGHGGEASASVTVTVEGVADAPTLDASIDAGTIVDGGGSSSGGGIEGVEYELAIDAALVDTDGSESLSLTVGGVPHGATLSCGTDNGNGTWTLDTSDLEGLTLFVPESVTEGFNLEITATAEEGNGDTASTVATISVGVDGSAETPSLEVSSAVGMEDTAVPLDIAAALTDTDGSESLMVTISGVPAGARLSAGTEVDGGVWELDADELEGLTLTPPADSNVDFDLTVTATATEGGGATATTTSTLHVDMTGVADQPTVSVSVGEGVPVTEGGGAETITITAGNFDDTDAGFTVMARNINSDGSLTDASADNVSSAYGGFAPNGANDGPDSQLGFSSYHDVSEELIVAFDGSVSEASVELGKLYANEGGHGAHEAGHYALFRDGVMVGESDFANDSGSTLTLTLAADDGGGFDQVVFTALDTFADGRGEGSWAHSDYVVKSVEFTTESEVVTATEYPVDIAAALGDVDGSEALTITVEGVPEGADLSAGTDNGNGSWSLTPAQLGGLALTVPASLVEDFSLTVTATATENDGDVAVATDTVLVDVAEPQPEPEPEPEPAVPVLTAEDVTGDEDTEIDLDVTADVPDAAHSLAEVVVTGLPEGVGLTVGTRNPDGSWSLNPNQVADMAVVPPDDYSGEFDITVTAVSTDGSSTSDVMGVTVEAVADAPELQVEAAAGAAGGAIPLDISAALTDTDGSETLSVLIAGVPEGVTLSAGSDLGGGTWSVEPADLGNLAINIPAAPATQVSLGGTDYDSLSDQIDGWSQSVDGHDITVSAFRKDGRETRLDGDLGRGIGVRGSGDSEIDAGRHSSESIEIDFDGMSVDTAEVGIRALFVDRGGSSSGGAIAEQGHWEAFRDGEPVGEGDFFAEGGAEDGSLVFDISVDGGFDKLVFTAEGRGSDYLLEYMNVESGGGEPMADFDLTVMATSTEPNGDTATTTATLSVDVTNGTGDVTGTGGSDAFIGDPQAGQQILQDVILGDSAEVDGQQLNGEDLVFQEEQNEEEGANVIGDGQGQGDQGSGSGAGSEVGAGYSVTQNQDQGAGVADSSGAS